MDSRPSDPVLSVTLENVDHAELCKPLRELPILDVLIKVKIQGKIHVDEKGMASRAKFETASTDLMGSSVDDQLHPKEL